MKTVIYGLGQAEMIMNALERSKEYFDMETEHNWVTGKKILPFLSFVPFRVGKIICFVNHFQD